MLEEDAHVVANGKRHASKLGIVGTLTVKRNSNVIPELCNEFILYYCKNIEKKPWMPSKDELILLVENMCHWLKKNKLTDSKLVQVASIRHL